MSAREIRIALLMSLVFAAPSAQAESCPEKLGTSVTQPEIEAVDRAFASARGLSPEAIARQGLWGAHRLDGPLTEVQKRQLIEELVRDGRDIVIVTDSHKGMRSGVVTVMDVLERYVAQMTDGKVKIRFYDSSMFPALDLPYQDMKVARIPRTRLPEIHHNAQAIHIALEGSLGIQVRAHLNRQRIPYTTAYHTARPEFVQETVAKIVKTLGIPVQKVINWLYSAVSTREAVSERSMDRIALGTGEPLRGLVNALLRQFHTTSQGVMVPTESMLQKLVDDGYAPASLITWSHGVELDLFKPELRNPSEVFPGLQGPISLYVGRIAPEKNLRAFLEMKVPGTKVLVGDGPELGQLKKEYPDAVFLGRKNYFTEVPAIMASADVFVFPSLTDTFGLVQLEALAAGTPVIGYRVQGPKDVIQSDRVGALTDYKPYEFDANVQGLAAAWKQAIQLDRKDCREYAENRSWERSVLEFLHFLARLPK